MPKPPTSRIAPMTKRTTMVCMAKMERKFALLSCQLSPS